MNEDYIYIVAGDEMEKLMHQLYPKIKTIPFREDLSKGTYEGFAFDDKFISNRSTFWNVSTSDYLNHMMPIINLNFNENYALCFGNDDCCKANLSFMINYLKTNGYKNKLLIQIVNEYDLSIIEEYYLNL